jgi:hypothetical protein
MIIVFVLVGLIFLSFVVGKIIVSIHFAPKVNALFHLAKSISQEKYHPNQIQHLPEPVKKYFNYTLKDGQSYISHVRVKHTGTFRSGKDKKWAIIKGEQYATTATPGFVWKGSTLMFTALDSYVDGKGQLSVFLLSLFTMVNAKGDKYNQGELLRWLGESVLYPTNLLPNDRLQWFPIDDSTARLTFSYRELSLFFVVSFSESGAITGMETKRYMNEDKLETWIIKLAQYKEMNHVMIPTLLEVKWRLAEGDFSYARFEIAEIQYDIAERY